MAMPIERKTAMKGEAARIPVTKLREEIMHLPELLEESEQVTVTRRGSPIATILSTKNYEAMREEIERMRQQIEAMQETIEILQDAGLMAEIRAGMRALQEGRTVSLEEARSALELE